jgi:biopolymer transport protein TolR
MAFHLDGKFEVGEDSRRSSSLFAEINMTPFVDVCLVLLIIFMVAAPFAISGVNVKLPETRAKSIQVTQESLVLSIAKDGKFYLDKKQIAAKDLATAIQGAVGADKKGSVIFIRADESVAYSKVMQGLSAAQQAGVERIAMIGEARGSGTK